MTTAEFFEAIFGLAIAIERKLSIFTIPGRSCARFERFEQAAEYALSRGQNVHVYHGMGLIAGEPAGRGKVNDTCAIGSLWCDLDVAGEAHAGTSLPTTKEIAEEFLRSLAVPPALVVDSGNGLHGYWPLETPLIFTTAAERQEAAQLARGWHAFICHEATQRGWRIENLGDLARVLRTPGTWNSKTPGQPALVRVVSNSGEVFGVESFQRLLLPKAASPKPTERPAMKAGHVGGLSPLDRCRLYLNELPPAVQGQHGGASTLVACKAIFRFGLDGADVRTAFEHYNSRCLPPWTNEKEIAHKLDDAAKSVDAAGERGEWLTRDSFASDPLADRAAAAILEHADGKRQHGEQETPQPPEADDEFPEDCLHVPGLIGDVMEYNLRTAMYAQPQLALAGALTLMGVLTGRKICDSRNTRTNIYVLGVAPSGAGKENARQVNKDILIHASSDGERMIGPERIGSSAGIVSAVSEQPTILFQIDELGKLLATMKNANKSPHLYNIASVLLQLYSSSSTTWVGDAYADTRKVKRINQPHACLYGTSTPEDFWGGMTSEGVSEGLLGRLLVFEGGYARRKTPACKGVPGIILERVRRWLEFRPGAGALSEINPNCLTVELDSGAALRLDGHLDAICERRESETATAAAVWSRSGEKTAKLALLFSCSRWTGEPGTAPIVELPDVDRAIKVVNWLTRRMLRKAFEHVAENETESRFKRVLRAIGTEISLNDLTRKTQWLRGRERREILADMQSCGIIFLGEKHTGGRPVTIIKKYPRENL